MEYLVTRDVTPQECPWLEQTIKQGSIVLAFHGYTYGCIGTGVAVTEGGGSAPFFEIPRDAIEEKEHVPQPYLGIPQWIPVSESLPDSGKLVLACFLTEQLKRPIIIRAAWYARYTEEAGDDEFEAGEYCEEKDAYYVREGWYESNQYEEVHWAVSDEITHWIELPAPPIYCVHK